MSSFSLREWGVDKADKVAILHPNCHCFLEAYYAVAQIGAVSVPINYRLSPREIAFVLQDSESKILIANQELQKLVDPVRSEIATVKKIVWTGKEGSLVEPRDVSYETALRSAGSHSISEPGTKRKINITIRVEQPGVRRE
jgi:fatty-acyl-CoA synthase